MAVYLVAIRVEQILMLQRFQTGYEDGKYSLVAGHVEPSELPSQAIIREAKEEAGLVIALKDLKVVHVLHRVCPDREMVDIFFLAKNWQGEAKNMEPDKCDEMKWAPLNQLPENTIPYVKKFSKLFKTKNFTAKTLL
jgi:ADP-ribose pyrophosphatase YjhB (NUDIX family)